jgi:uncharacterized repeat protein (TIGR03803 family)
MLYCVVVFFLGLRVSAPAQAQIRFQVIHRFADNPGYIALAQPTFDGAGNLYVGTEFGGVKGGINCGINGCGTIYQVNPTAGARPLYEFLGGSDGASPIGRLLLDSAGNIYGATYDGGGSNEKICQINGAPEGCGTVFELSPVAGGGFQEKVLYAFTKQTEGYFPAGGVIFDGEGNLYGTTGIGGSTTCGSNGCGAVYKLTHNTDGSWTESVLHAFSGTAGTDGCDPSGELTFDSAGNLYGTTWGCGANQGGIIYELSPASGATWTETVLYNFVGATGSGPMTGLTFDVAGNLYGTTSSGGADGEGTVFELSPALGGWTHTILHNFRGGKGDGAFPRGAISFDAAGNIYSTTAQGGPATAGCTSGCGIVFKLSASSGWAETAMHVFQDGNDGASPEGGVVIDSAGNIYGTVSSLLYRITP